MRNLYESTVISIGALDGEMLFDLNELLGIRVTRASTGLAMSTISAETITGSLDTKLIPMKK